MTSLSAIPFQNNVNSIVKSFSQLFFSEKNYVGYCFIVFVGYLSYRALLFAILAVIVGNLFGLLFFKYARHIVNIGGIGYNCIIVGLYLTPFILNHVLLGLITLVLLSILTVLINHLSRLFLHRYGMPALTIAPIITLMIAYLSYYYLFHMDIRNQFNVIFNAHYLIIFYIGYLFIYLIANYKIGIFVLLTTLPIFLISFFLRINMIYLIINIAIIVYAFPAYFIQNHRLGWMASAYCIIPCIILYGLGQVIYFYTGICVLLLPAVFSIWIICAYWFGKFYQLPIFFAMAQLIDLLKSSVKSGKKMIALTGAGVSTLSGIPDYASGQWLDENIPTHYYTFYAFLESRCARKFYFDSCDKFLMLSKQAKTNVIHRVLYALQKQGLLQTIITQNVDGLLQKAGCKEVIELHGNIDHLECLRCGKKTCWPAQKSWHAQDLYCDDCRGFLKPAVKAYQEPLNIETWENAVAACHTADVVLILGSRLLVQSVIQLVDLAKVRGAKIIFINDTLLPNYSQEGDIFVQGKLEKILPVVAKLI